MAASELTVAQISRTGIEPALVAANVDGNFFDNDGMTFLNVNNADASPHTITVDSVVDCDQGVDHNVVVVVGASENHLIGPFPVGRFNDSNAQAQITYDAVTSVTIEPVRLPRV